MNAKKCTVLSVFSLGVLAVVVLSLGCGKDPVGPTIPKPVIDIFTANPNDIIPPDSALITWKVRLADSVIIFPAGQKLNPKDSGQVYVNPSVPTEYKLVAYSGGGKDSAQISVVMSTLAANIVSFRITPDTVVIGDSSLVAWRTTQADSIVINQGIGKKTPTDTGQFTIFLSNTLTYRAVAYSIFGNDTAQINVRVKNPAVVRTLGSAYYKGLMGQSSLSPALRYAVADAQSNLLENLWVNLRLLEGDGTIIPADSALTDSASWADVSYNFSGALGHAVISANFRDVDTVDVFLRANTLIPGIGGQGQYMFFTETFADIKNYNGNPEAVDDDPRPNVTVVYAVYESIRKVVFSILDANDDGLAQDNEEILAVQLTAGYPYKTKDSIGVGSTYNEVKAVYGQPDLVEYDPSPPPALVFYYDSLGMIFYTDTVTGNPADTNETVFEIHLHDFITPPVTGKITSNNPATISDSPVTYRRFRK